MPLTTSDMSHFECQKCGNCCRQPGYVRLKPDEPDTIAAFLKMDVYLFIEQYTTLTLDRQTLSLVEKQDHSCVFLTPQGCRINPVKPGQCLTFPHGWRFSNFDTVCQWAKQIKSKA
jgi:Fe-S-cluster containining protein